MYNSGYANYSNPYYVEGGDTAAYYDYSQPITVINQQPDAVAAAAVEPAAVAAAVPAAAVASPEIATPDAQSPSPEIQEGTTHMELARAAFQQEDYAAAAREVDLAIRALPKDAVLHEFRALIFFATKDYKQAAATLYAVLSAGPGWDWTTLSGMYGQTSTYTDQLRTLEEYVKANPASADARFVLAYHYLTCGHTEAARTQYETVLKLQPNDELSAQLLALVGGTAEAPSGANPTPQPPDVESPEGSEPTPPKDIEASQIVGNWTARRKDGAIFKLNLAQDEFTWSFDKKGKRDEFGGKYSVDGAILVLERNDGAQMPGLITMADHGFNFKLFGGAPDDPGLDFKE
jgi:tetratricopeptide (TPR) repeat protein